MKRIFLFDPQRNKYRWMTPREALACKAEIPATDELIARLIMQTSEPAKSFAFLLGNRRTRNAGAKAKVTPAQFREYVRKNPRATNKAIAAALNVSLRTVISLKTRNN